MNIIDQLHTAFFSFLDQHFAITTHILGITFDLNVDLQKKQFGDISSNAALILAKQQEKNARELATEIANQFTHAYLERIEVAGPGFINFFLTPEAYRLLLIDMYEYPQKSFASDLKKERYSVEFVSANPTGPLHLGHGRGGIIGDVLGNILSFLGHQVTKEYYINDAGSQIQKLGNSLKIRCQQALGIDVALPEDGYQGEYLKDLAIQCIKEYGKDLLEKPNSFFAEYAKNYLLEQIKKTLETYAISFNLWFSEKTLHEDGSIERTLQILIDHGFTYQLDDALWFTSTQFGDDKDRVLRKTNGELTYIAADVAYTKNKFDRVDRAILILGQDHHSYVVRLKGITQALGYNPDNLEVILYQLITLNEQGEQLRMSKRAGTMVTLKEIIETVGTDVARFFFLNRKADAHLDFDLSLALKKTEENPVYYIQYAYVRTKSILQKAQEKEELSDINKNDVIAINIQEHLLLRKIISLKNLLRSINNNYQTHLLTYYVLELAQTFHAYYSKNRVIDMSNIAQSRARLLLINVLKNTFELCLDLLGLSKPEKM
ncbi:MAG: arginine--tRNA ligase [Candidatus Babeliales bacterium]